MKPSIRWIVAIFVIFAALQLAACSPAPAAKGKTAPSKIEPIEGTEFKRVVLTEKAAERLDIQTAAVRSEPTTRVRRVGGQVVPSPSKLAAPEASADSTGSDAQTSNSGRLWVRVNLSESELNQVDRTQPARVLALDSDDEEDSDGEEDGLEAELDDDDGAEDAEDADQPGGASPLYYTLDDADHTLTEGQPVFVKLTLTGGGTERKIVPFAALLYGVHGETWVYTNAEPLVFVRAPVTVEYIEDEMAYLSEGPPVGTEVVTVGGSLLYGAETGVSK